MMRVSTDAELRAFAERIFDPEPRVGTEEEDVELMRRLRQHARPVLLDGPLTVSVRRWRRRGVVRQTATNWALLLAYHAGFSPERLARWYGREQKID